MQKVVEFLGGPRDGETMPLSPVMLAYIGEYTATVYKDELVYAWPGRVRRKEPWQQ